MLGRIMPRPSQPHGTNQGIVQVIQLIVSSARFTYFFASSFMPAWIQAFEAAALASISSSVSLLVSKAV